MSLAVGARFCGILLFRLANVQGFRGQVGGWNLKSSGQACILALWQDEDAYRKFMEHEHDEIVSDSKQEETINAVYVTLFRSVLDMPGELKELHCCFNVGAVLRVTDCILKPGREEHFLEAERDIWAPKMGNSAGMLGGIFSKSIEQEQHYLVTTFWRSLEDHANYVRDVFPEISSKARPDNDISELTSSLVNLEPNWTVLPATKT